jgi:hypothetical protein
MDGCGLGSSDLGQGQVVRPRQQGNEHLGSKKY